MGPNEQVRTQQSRASGAVHSSRYDVFCDPYEVPGGLRASQGRPRGVSGRSRGGPRNVPGSPRGVPGVPTGVPRGSWDPRGLRGRPRHPRDPFHKDDSMI